MKVGRGYRAYALIITILLLASILSLVNGCGVSQLRIGVILPLSGNRQRFGESMKRGFEMALADFDREPSLKGRMACYFEDDSGVPEKSRQCADRLARKRKAHVLIGSYNNLCTLALVDKAEALKIPLISPTAASEEVSRKGYHWVFRLNAPTSCYALSMLDFLTTSLDVHSIAVIYENDDFGSKTAAQLNEYSGELKGTVVHMKGYETGTKNFAPLLLEIDRLKPDALIMVSHIEDGLELMKTVGKLNLHIRIYAGCGAGFALTDFLERGRADAERLFTITQWNPDADWPGARDFALRYRSLYGRMPDYHSAEAYAAIQVLAACLATKFYPERSRMRKALADTDTETIFGRIRFESYDAYTNQNSHTVLIQQVQKGHYVIVWPREYKRGEIMEPTIKGRKSRRQ
jgi:branched-chain amino acid transport system substrate-binding protein